MDLALGWVDLAMLVLLALSVLVGLARGFVFEVLSLLGWIAAYFAAHWAAPQLAPQLPIGTAGSALNYGAAFAIVFVLTLIVWSVAAGLLRRLLHATPLSVVDRLLGAGFGFARGMILLMVLATLVSLTPLAKDPAWKQSLGRPWLDGVLRGLKPVLPDEVSRLLPA
ncbi:MAG: CvpA family protein [Burkholderiaceae bacterium]